MQGKQTKQYKPHRKYASVANSTFKLVTIHNDIISFITDIKESNVYKSSYE